MEKLEKVIRTIGILTNIGSSHDEGFVDLENKIKEKLILFKDVEILIYQRDLIDKLIFPKIKTFSWSESRCFVYKRRQRAKALFYISNTKEPPIS
jgi:alanine racemase